MRPPSYLRQHGYPTSPHRLREEGHVAVNFFSAKTGRVFEFDFVRGEEKLTVRLPHRAAANDADTYLALGIAGLGLVQSPRTRHVQSIIDGERLVCVLSDWSAGAMPLYVMYPRHRHLSARLRVFVDWVVEVYARKFAALAVG